MKKNILAIFLLSLSLFITVSGILTVKQSLDRSDSGYTMSLEEGRALDRALVIKGSIAGISLIIGIIFLVKKKK